MKHLLPKWKSGGKQDMVRQIYGDNAKDMLRESMGVTTNDNCCVFQDEWLDKFSKRSPYTPASTPSVVFVACDPNGGGLPKWPLCPCIKTKIILRSAA